MLRPQRCHLPQTALSAQFGRYFCLCPTGSPRSKLLQQNESYFHNLHINWNWMGYVTSLEYFVRQEVQNLDMWDLVHKVLGWIFIQWPVSYWNHSPQIWWRGWGGNHFWRPEAVEAIMKAKLRAQHKQWDLSKKSFSKWIPILNSQWGKIFNFDRHYSKEIYH